jgi:hypothetical protein
MPIKRRQRAGRIEIWRAKNRLRVVSETWSPPRNSCEMLSPIMGNAVGMEVTTVVAQ